MLFDLVSAGLIVSGTILVDGLIVAARQHTEAPNRLIIGGAVWLLTTLVTAAGCSIIFPLG